MQCPTCNREFERRRPSRPQVYCSRQCVGRAVGRMPRLAPSRVRDYVCAHCGAAFSCYHKNRKFCTQACAWAARTKPAPTPEILQQRRMRRAGRKDNNHSEIVQAFERLGAAVMDLSGVGNGCPDLLVSIGATLHLVEIKNPTNSYGKRGLNKWQQVWADKWKGAPVMVVRTVDEVIALFAK